MKYLHVFPGNEEKFFEPYINFISRNFDMNEHFFYILGTKNKKIEHENNIAYLCKDIKSKKVFIHELRQCKVCFIHGLFSIEIIKHFLSQPWLLKKSSWIVWGGDLYHYKFRKRTFKYDVYEKMRKFIIKRFNRIITLTPGDYDLAKKWYKVKSRNQLAIYVSAFDYSSLDYLKVEKEENKRKTIQIGNSASETNKHFEALKQLKKFEKEDFCIRVPLAYGDKNYAQEVVAYGKELWGDRFIPLLEMQSPEEYAKYLADIDIAIFAFERQQGLGNIYQLLYLEKKVYIRNDTSTWEYFEELGIKVNDYRKLKDESFFEFIESNKNKSSNVEKIKKLVSEEHAIELWEKIFND